MEDYILLSFVSVVAVLIFINMVSRRQPLISNNTAVRLYILYCSLLILYIIHGTLFGPQHASIRQRLSDKVFVNLHESSLTVCQRKVKVSFGSGMVSKKKEHQAFKPVSMSENEGNENKVLVVIGHDKMNHVQTNNKLNAILHAMDYAQDINADLALIRGGWPTKTLKLLFGYDYDHNSHGDDRDNAHSWEWEQSIELNLHLRFLDDDDNLEEVIKGEGYSNVYYNISDDIYYYHTNSSIDVIKRRRQPVLEYLWSHPTISNREKGRSDDGSSDISKHDMCNVVNSVNMDMDMEEGEISHGSNDPVPGSVSVSIPGPGPGPGPTQYTVVHSRWMKKNGCLNRMGGLAQRIKNMTGISIDRKAPCLLEPLYIRTIVKKCGLIGRPIFVISDGLNPDIVPTLQKDSIIGKYIRTVPEDKSWVGGDMMLGVLSDCFIGTPISTLSGNIARARVALGKEPWTNYLFPEKKKRQDGEGDGEEEYQFSCQDNVDCLYDVRFLNHYVG